MEADIVAGGFVPGETVAVMDQLVSDSDTEMEIQDILQDAQHMRRDLDTHGRQERQGVTHATWDQ